MEDEWGIQAIDFGNAAEVRPCQIYVSIEQVRMRGSVSITPSGT